MSSDSATITPEIVEPEQKELLAVVQQNALQPETAQSLEASFAPLFSQAKALISQSRSIVVTDVTQTAQIELSRAFRLQLRKVRIAGESLRKSLKEDSLKRGKAIDAFNTILLHLVDGEETRLDEQEKIVERQESARKEALKTERKNALAPYGIDTTFISLAEMPEATFQQLLENSRAAHEAKLAASRKAEEDRIAAENARLKEEARIREENARLKREADERELAAKVERERIAAEKAAAEEELKAERERVAREQAEARAETERRIAAERKEAEAQRAMLVEKQRVASEEARVIREGVEAKARAERAELERKTKAAEAELKAQKAAAAKRLAAEEALRKKAAAAPDKEKLTAWADDLPGLSLMSTPEGERLATELTLRCDALEAWLRGEISKL